MLWWKAWREIKWRFAFALATVLAGILAAYARNGPAYADTNTLLLAVSLMWLISAGLLAGSGVKTQDPLQAGKGLNGSTQFTLSLPVSRLRLVYVRANVGLAAMVAMMVISTIAAMLLFPNIRARFSATDLAMWIVTAACCGAAFHAISILTSMVLSDVWQMWAAFLIVGALKALSVLFALPAQWDVFDALVHASPLIKHSLPWPAILISLVVSGVIFRVAVKIAQTREFC